jgi:hypothetical protein
MLNAQGRITSTTDWIFNGAISPRWDAQGAAIVYNRSSPSIYPLIAARIRYPQTPLGTWAAGEIVLASSPATDTDRSCINPAGDPCRWGDYAAATPDPVQQNLVWGTSEFNTAAGSNPAWSNQNFAIAPTPEAPRNVTASALRSNAANIKWYAGGAEDPGSPAISYTVKSYSGGVPGPTMTTTGGPTIVTLTFTGLVIGAVYTFTVIANSASGPSLESAPSNAVVVGDGAFQATGPPAPSGRDIVNQAPDPGAPVGR